MDGVSSDWPTMATIAKGVSVAAANDRTRLVIAIVTSDAPVQARILSAGLIVYIDPKGGKNKTL